jgi:hypothetical protein
MNMKTIFTVFFIVMVVCTGTSCKPKDKADLNNIEEAISDDISRMLWESMMDMGLSGVKLKTAPKNSNAPFIGTVTYLSGSGRFDSEILANYDSDTELLTWWFSDEPGDAFVIYLGEPIYQMVYDSPGYYPEEYIQPSAEIGQATNAQPSDTLGKVEQSGSKYTTFDSRGRQITYFSNPNTELVGWGKDFFVIRSRTTFYTYDPHCKQISSISIGGATTVTVEAESFTVRVGSSNQRYNRSCRRI